MNRRLLDLIPRTTPPAVRRWHLACAVAVAVLALVLPRLLAAYTYYYSLSIAPYNNSAISSNDWWINSIFGDEYLVDANGLVGPAANLISKAGVPSGSADYEVKVTIPNASAPRAGVYLRASSDAKFFDVNGNSTGTFYMVYFNGVGIYVYKQTGNQYLRTLLGVAQAPGLTSPGVMRVVMRGNKISVFLNGQPWGAWTDSEISAGQPGVGSDGVYYRYYPTGISGIDLGAIETVAPTPSGTTPTVTATSPYSVTLNWQAGADDANGSGLVAYAVLRNGVQIATTSTPGWVDNTAAEFATYTYTIRLVDYHGNTADMTPVTVTTPHVPGPWATPPDGRHTGVRPTGSYWGGSGEQIDLLTGNVNYTTGLVKAQGRGIAAAFGLSYNSQTWRKDGTGGSAVTNKLGQDVGYGLGWRLMAGSITPYWSGPFTPAYYLFADSSGAEYRLDTNDNGIWRTKEGVYLSYDPAAKKLYFNDGTFWYMGAVSTGSEQDGGTWYPTLMQNTNGNQILISYKAGIGTSTPNTSARIDKITDVRSVPGAYSYQFNYNADSIPHLTSITDVINSGANYTFAYTAPYTVVSPFAGGGGSFGTAVSLATMTQTSANLANQFQYNTSGELTKVIHPMGGEFRYAYRDFSYTSGGSTRTLREINTRTLVATSGGTLNAYSFVRDDAGDATRPFHAWACVNDASGVSAKKWTFETNSAVAGYSLAKTLEERPTLCTATEGAGTPALVMRKEETTWAVNSSGNPYVQQAVSRMGTNTTTGGSAAGAYANTQSTQTVDQYGNTLTKSVYNFGASSPTWVSTMTYLTDSNYTSRYIRNRMTSSSITYGGATIPQTSVIYDNYVTPPNGAPMETVPGKVLHDYANYPTSFIYRGNPTRVVQGSSYYGGVTIYDELGVPKHTLTCQTGSCFGYVDVTTDGTDTVPTSITPNSNSSLSTSIVYDGAMRVTSSTAPNGATSTIGYDAAGRAVSGSSPLGSTVSMTYPAGNGGGGPVPFGSKVINPANSDPRWVRTTTDGLGRTVKVESGHGNGGSAVVVSVMETEYQPCGCTPMGKMKKASLPYAPGGTVYWTTYNYDALGRTLSVVLPNSMGQTTYSYDLNTVTVTDAAGKWKKFTMNADSTLVSVEEPNPAGGASLFTNYTYTHAGQLATVSMPRSGGTQTRSFSYDILGRSVSVTQPETGTSMTSYNLDGTVANTTDAKGQKKTFDYDSYKRVTAVRRWVNSTTEDVNQKVEYYYDSNSFESGMGSNLAGRLAATRYWAMRAAGEPKPFPVAALER